MADYAFFILLNCLRTVVVCVVRELLWKSCTLLWRKTSHGDNFSISVACFFYPEIILAPRTEIILAPRTAESLTTNQTTTSPEV